MRQLVVVFIVVILTLIYVAFPAPIFASAFFYHILSTGQSLSIGYLGSPALTITQPYNNKMLTGSSIPLIPLVEGNNNFESMSSSMANSITSAVAGNDYDIIVTRHGVGATAYSGLKKGTAPYSNGITQVNNAKYYSGVLGKLYKVTAVTTIHGESDILAGTTQAQYEADLVEWQNDYETDVRAITGQADAIPMFTDQVSSWSGLGFTTSVIPYAQLAASEDYPGKVILVGPKYFFDYVHIAHLNNLSYRWLGEYYGKVYKKVVIDGVKWTPLSPKEIVRDGNIIYVQFNVPVPPITFDTTAVDLKSNYGFEYADDNSSASIMSVQIFNYDTVKITLSTTPTGANQKLRYAYTGTIGANPGAHVDGSPRGNLRDNDNTPSLYGNKLYNWSVHFDKTIAVDHTAPVISNILVTPSASGAVIKWTTNENSTSNIDYGFTKSYGSSSGESDVSSKVSNHSVTLSNLINCTTYHFRIRSKDLAQNEGVSSDTTFTTSGGIFPGIPPKIYNSVPQNANSILLFFTDVANPIDRYIVQYGKKSGNYTYGSQDVNGNNGSYTVKSLIPDTNYYFRIKRSGNNCPWSNEIYSKTSTFSVSTAISSSPNETVVKPVVVIVTPSVPPSSPVPSLIPPSVSNIQLFLEKIGEMIKLFFMEITSSLG